MGKSLQRRSRLCQAAPLARTAQTAQSSASLPASVDCAWASSVILPTHYSSYTSVISELRRREAVSLCSTFVCVTLSRKVLSSRTTLRPSRRYSPQHLRKRASTFPSAGKLELATAYPERIKLMIHSSAYGGPASCPLGMMARNIKRIMPAADRSPGSVPLDRTGSRITLILIQG